MPRIFSGKIIFTLLFLLAMDICFIPSLQFFFLHPVLIYLMVLHAAFEWNVEKAFRMALLVGILRDLTSSQLLGIETTSLVLGSLVLCYVVQQIDRKSELMKVIIAFLFVLLVSSLILFLYVFLAVPRVLTLHALESCFVMAISTAMVMPLFSYLMGRWLGERIPLKQYELFE